MLHVDLIFTLRAQAYDRAELRVRGPGDPRRLNSWVYTELQRLIIRQIASLSCREEYVSNLGV